MSTFWSTFALFLLAMHAFAEPVLRYDASASKKMIPYYTGNEEMPGIVEESLQAILNGAGITPVPIALPPKRTLKALEKGELDFHVMSIEWFPDSDYGDDYVMSEPFVTIREYVTVSSEKAANSVGVSLAGKRVGTVLGYYYHDMETFDREDFPSERELIKALKLNRVDVAVLGDLPALYWAQQLDIPIRLLQLHSKGELRMRLRKDKQALLPAINRAIQTLKNNQTFSKIEHKYRLHFNLPLVTEPFSSTADAKKIVH